MSSLFVNEDENENDTEIQNQNHIANDTETHFVNENANENETLTIPLNAIRNEIQAETTHREQGSIPVHFEEPDVVPIYPSREVNCTLPLKYQQEIVEDMLTKDGLLILGRGLGWDLISANLLHALSSPSVTLRHGPAKTVEKRGLVFVLNAMDDEIVRLKEELTDLQWLDDDENSSFVVITNESQVARKNLYLKGGIISIKSRLLVVDLLAGSISADDITGLFVLHAERLRETSDTSFVVSLFRDENSWGFIKAISDEPESFGGFTPLATKLKVLRLSNVFLWPRFHVEVSASLKPKGKRKEADTRQQAIEINTKLTSRSNKIQAALITCMEACLHELRRHNPELATEYWDKENIHDPNFVIRIRISLNPQWHRLSRTSKQLYFDLETLTGLLNKLLSMDSVSFYQEVQGIVDLNVRKSSSGMESSISPWLNLTEASTIIAYSKERALMKHSVGSDSEEYLLEELPKWHELGNMLDDIFHEKSLSSENSGPILIMCSDTRTARQLYQVIESMKEIKVSGKKYFSSRRFMISKLHEYLQWKEINNLSKQLNEDLEKSEDQTEEQIITSKSFTRNGQPASKRRRTRGASSTARVAKLYSGENRGAVDIDENVLGQMDQEIVESEEDDVVETGPTGLFVETEDIIVPSLSHINMGDQVIIQVYDEGRNDALLQEISPSYIIMYEPNLSFIRRTEIFQAINRDQPAKVFVMFYSNSTEEQKYLLRLKKEKDAFTKLIREKASLSKHFETSEDNYKFQIQRNQTMNTRIAGGASFRTTDEMRIVVDSREFGASLPNLLYRIGIKVVPCMLTVGDYVISPKICVERKAIPDLVSSFKSGRLFTQCSQMFKHYETPTLLIEFDENKSFSLQQYADSRFLKGRAETANDSPINQSLQSKIMELLVAYPKLKIIWSSSPYETAQIFMSLKANQEEPDVESALNKGVSKEVITEDGGPPNFNDDPIDFIQNIPGINDMNYYKIIQNVRNLEELVQLSKEQFVKLLGKENGKKAYNFINHRIK